MGGRNGAEHARASSGSSLHAMLSKQRQGTEGETFLKITKVVCYDTVVEDQWM